MPYNKSFIDQTSSVNNTYSLSALVNLVCTCSNIINCFQWLSKVITLLLHLVIGLKSRTSFEPVRRKTNRSMYEAMTEF